MKNLNSLLCNFGIHRWKKSKHFIWSSNTIDIDMKCKRCGKEKRVNKARPKDYG